VYPDAAAATDPDWSDYVYLSDDIRNLATDGNSAGSATIINRFSAGISRWSFDRLDDRNLGSSTSFSRLCPAHIND
jgi:hypothetical protein